ncbi:hypothetical protein GH714_031663 [Hevea brasiliensis]|uniref:ER membrane protein complex subunit 1 n=1 Tax=Hevea brasiliensis TaxID=3981 RepID=A0A6A6LWQ1_HEVBR|nr:hypothetical protein GH714_031663 [Hevea brasiliensis]
MLISTTISTFSLYEDQVGLMDWHQQYVGKVRDAVFHTQKTGRKRVVVSTEENVIASLDLRRRDLHVLGANDAIDGIDIAMGKCNYAYMYNLSYMIDFIHIITLSSEGSILRAWNLPDGQMVWESFLHSPNHSKSLLLVPTSLKIDKDNVILVFGKGCLHAISSIHGEILWKKDFAAESFDVQHVIQPLGSDIIYVVGFVDSSQFNVYQMNAKNGELLKHESAAFSGGFSGKVSLVSSSTLVMLDSTGSTLITVNFHNGEINFQKTHISDLIEETLGMAMILPSKLTGMFALKTSTFTIFIRVTGEGKLEVVDEINHVTAVSDAVSFSEGQQAFALVEHHYNDIYLTLKLGQEWNSDLLKESIKLDRQRGMVHKVFINNYIRTDRSHGFRALIVMEDHSLLLLQQGEIVWSREDGLASVIDVTMSELPVEKKGVSVAKVEQNLFEWLKVFALHTGDGRIVWSLLLNSLRKSETCVNPTRVNLYQWQVPHHHAMGENPSVLVVCRCGSSSDSPDSTEQRLHLLIDAQQQAHLYPKTPEAVGIFQREFSNIYWYSVEADDGIIKGHALKGNCVGQVSDEYCFETKDMWSIVFPLESEKILTTVTRKLNEVVHTQAKVIAERDVMYKYISKNLLFVVTVAPKATGGIGSATPEESWLVAYLVDTVTGHMLHRMTHHGSHGPVHAVFSENWVVYHYFNLRAHRYEMSVVEIFDQSRADNKDVWKLAVGKHNLASPISSYSRPEVLALNKHFLDPRRSINPTQAEREEGIIPLTDSLPIIPQSYVTHALQVEGLRGVVTAPAKLESTALVFAYGVGLFFTRLAPSRTYDSLTEDFNYDSLLITIVHSSWQLSSHGFCQRRKSYETSGATSRHENPAPKAQNPTSSLLLLRFLSPLRPNCSQSYCSSLPFSSSLILCPSTFTPFTPPPPASLTLVLPPQPQAQRPLLKAPQAESSSSSSSSASQSFTQWRFPLVISPLHQHSPPESLAQPKTDPRSESLPSVTQPLPPPIHSSELQEIFHVAELQLSSESESEKLAALHLLERSLVPNPPTEPVCPLEVMRGVVVNLKNKAGAKLATKILLALCLEEENRHVAVKAGTVGSVVEVAMELEGPTAERALAALELACTVEEGAAELRAHALAMPVMVAKMGKWREGGKNML